MRKKHKSSKMSVMKYLTLRSKYESLVSGFILPKTKYQGTMDAMEWFVRNGHTANRFRKGFDDVIEVCNKVLENMK